MYVHEHKIITRCCCSFHLSLFSNCCCIHMQTLVPELWASLVQLNLHAQIPLRINVCRIRLKSTQNGQILCKCGESYLHLTLCFIRLDSSPPCWLLSLLELDSYWSILLFWVLWVTCTVYSVSGLLIQVNIAIWVFNCSSASMCQHIVAI